MEKKCNFERIDIGGTFDYDGCTYVKTRNYYNTPKGFGQAFNFVNMDIYMFPNSTEVTPVKAKLIISPLPRNSFFEEAVIEIERK